MEFNFIDFNDFWDAGTETALFQTTPDDRCLPIGQNEDMFDLLVRTGIFKSKGDARRNWKLTGKDIPPGFSDFQGIGKHRHRITIWVPVEDKEP